MGFFDFLFGSSHRRYSQEQHTFSNYEIEEFFQRIRIPSLTLDEKHLVKEAIRAARKGDAKISMRQIADTLKSLRYRQGVRISEADRQALIEKFEEYFEKRFGEVATPQ